MADPSEDAAYAELDKVMAEALEVRSDPEAGASGDARPARFEYDGGISELTEPSPDRDLGPPEAPPAKRPRVLVGPTGVRADISLAGRRYKDGKAASSLQNNRAKRSEARKSKQ